ncbi:hypothetical protein HX52_21645 [Salmonella enterica]|nr:hypothetical protein [Salmonella enterica]EBL7698166.1 hypothetical protein [Salmonella enterica]EDU6130942.1 hypothetical protein [Salmonella enterica subsp. enterica]
MKYSQVTTSMAKDIAFKLGAVLNDEEATIFADGYNVALLKVNKDMSTAVPNNASLSTNSPIIPEEIPKGLAGQIVSLLAHNIGDKFLAQKIWNSCRAAMLQANQRDLSQPVDPQVTKYEQIMLQAGWVMVPIEPTDEMIAAAMECEDVLFNSDGSFCVQFREIYCAMVDAALALNKGEY